MDKEPYTYISRELLEGVEHVKTVEINNPCGQCVIVSESLLRRLTEEGVALTHTLQSSGVALFTTSMHHNSIRLLNI